jgi:hypothetical protein
MNVPAASIQIGNWTFPNHACEVDHFDVNTTYAVPEASAYAFLGVDHHEKTIVAAFQGTSDRVDWITDLSTWLHYGYEVRGPRAPCCAIRLRYFCTGNRQKRARAMLVRLDAA